MVQNLKIRLRKKTRIGPNSLKIENKNCSVTKVRIIENVLISTLCLRENVRSCTTFLLFQNMYRQRNQGPVHIPPCRTFSYSSRFPHFYSLRKSGRKSQLARRTLVPIPLSLDEEETNRESPAGLRSGVWKDSSGHWRFEREI